VVQSAAVTHSPRQIPSAQMRPMEQSLFSEHPFAAGVFDDEHAGTASDETKAAPTSHAAAEARYDLSGLRVIRFIDSPP
jgi:hypothetical protein